MVQDIIKAARKVREALINRHGGIEGYFEYCQALDRARLARSKPRKRKTTARSAKKRMRAG